MVGLDFEILFQVVKIEVLLEFMLSCNREVSVQIT